MFFSCLLETNQRTSFERTNNQYLSLCFSDDTPNIIKPTTPMHKDNAERPLEHISNNIAKSNNPIPKLQYFTLRPP